LHVKLRHRLGVIAEVLLPAEGRQILRVIVIWVTLLLGVQNYSRSQVGQSSDPGATVENGVALGAEPQVISDVMLAAGAADYVMNVQLAATIGLGPPAHGTAAMLLHPLNQGGSFGLIHATLQTVVRAHSDSGEPGYRYASKRRSRAALSGRA
jgi:hypothetical protein